MLLSDAQSTGLRDLSLCHWVVNVGELSSGAPSQLEPLSRLGCDDATTVALKPESMPRVSLAATKGTLRYVVLHAFATRTPTSSGYRGSLPSLPIDRSSGSFTLDYTE